MRLDRRKFLAWLKTKRPDEAIGNRQDCHSCPLANFYYDASQGCEVVIADNGLDGCYYIDRGYDNRRLPRWAGRFVRGVDNETGSVITARRAIEIMMAC